MSELTDKLKVTRGKGYYTVLKQILAGCGKQIIADARVMAESGKLTVLDVGHLAKKYDLNYKATCEWLEENGVIPTGTHQELVRRGLKAREVLEAVREAKG